MDFRAQAKFTPVDLVKLQARIVPKLVAAVREGCAAVVDEAQAIAPVRSGELHDSIHTATIEVVGTTVQGSVVADAPHAGFVEFGTGLRGDGTYPGPLPETGVPYTGEWVYDFRSQGWQGMPAHPYMRPALDTSRAAILGAYTKQGFKV